VVAVGRYVQLLLTGMLYYPPDISTVVGLSYRLPDFLADK
jgi:hypothetical protein